MSDLRKRAAPELEPGTFTAWKYFRGMGGSISGVFLSCLDDEKELFELELLLLELLLVVVRVSSVSEIRNTFDVELMERCR